MRIFLFLLTNIAVVIVAGIILNLVGISSYIQDDRLNLTSLLIFCFVFGMVGSFISLFLSKWMAKRATRARLIDPEATTNSEVEAWLCRTTAQLAQDAGIGMPEVAIFPAQQSNAFATGWNKNASLVAVSEGLLQRFDRDQIRAVLAHEIGHIANGDMVTLALIQGVVNTFVMFFARVIGYFVDKVVFRNERGFGLGYFMAVIFAEIILGILASTIVFWFSRRREYRADAYGAKLVGRSPMIEALRGLQDEVKHHVEGQMPKDMTAFGISSGFKKNVFKLFSTHPPLESRIRALEDATS